MIYDREFPWVLTIPVHKATPKSETIMIPMYVGSIVTFIPSTSTIDNKTVTYRYSDEYLARWILERIKNGVYCAKCQKHPRECTKKATVDQTRV